MGKYLIYKLCPRLLVARHLNYPPSNFLFIHAHKVMYSWGLSSYSHVEWQPQTAYFPDRGNMMQIKLKVDGREKAAYDFVPS